jgi:hypothetical protein
MRNGETSGAVLLAAVAPHNSQKEGAGAIDSVA